MSEVPAPAAAGGKKERKTTGLPPGLLYYKDGVRLQVRIKQSKDGKMVQINRPIPGTYADLDEALAAQAAAQCKWNSGEVVWASEPAADRNKRGQVRSQPSLPSLPSSFI